MGADGGLLEAADAEASDPACDLYGCLESDGVRLLTAFAEVGNSHRIP